MKRLKQYYATVRHLKLRQIVYQLWYRLYRAKRFRPPPVPPLRKLENWTAPICPPSSMSSPREFNFLNQPASLDKVGWSGSGQPLLWRYHQHYFDDLNATDSRSRRVWHQELISDWIAQNPPAAGVGWDAYPTSLRVVNWVKWALSGGTLSKHATASLAAQLHWISRRIEYHIDGNHIIKNGKALIFGGAFFCWPEMLRKGARLIRKALKEQILDDGGHYELSPMYHAQVLEDVLDLVNLSRTFPEGKSVENICRPYVQPMLQWLECMTHPDGGPAFFNDSCFRASPTFRELQDYARRLGFGELPKARVLRRSGYVRLDAAKATCILDVGEIGARHQPGHGHADALSFEMSLAGQRVLVNSGISTYAAGALRDQQRGTAAHNTVCVDGKNQSDLWAAFRVGRRAHVSDVQVDGNKVAATHDGYVQRGGPAHRRAWELSTEALIVDDVLTGPFETACANFYFHPDIDLRLQGKNAGVGISPGGVRIEWVQEGGEQSLKPAKWYPEFGTAMDSSCLCIQFSGPSLRTRFHWGD